MTQHEYIFIAVSIILGLAITRLLNNAAMLLRGREHIDLGLQHHAVYLTAVVDRLGFASASGVAVYGLHCSGVRVLLPLWGI